MVCVCRIQLHLVGVCCFVNNTLGKKNLSPVLNTETFEEAVIFFIKSSKQPLLKKHVGKLRVL